MKLNELQSLYSESILYNVDFPFQNQITPCGNLSISEVTSVYKQAYLFRMKEVMYDNFGSLLFVLGDQTFDITIENYINKNHHISYDLSDYGKTFPNFLVESFPELPFLKDLAEFELEFTDSFHKKEHKSFDFTNLQNHIELENTVFEFGETVKLIHNQFSVYSIWKNRYSKLQPDLNKTQNQEYLLLYKQNSNIYVLSLDAVEFYFIDLLHKGNSIGISLEKTNTHFHLNPEIISTVFGRISASGIVKNIFKKP
ncbi:DNA-binding domain-containing protein [Leptospira sp. 2 VSF19]|uniref:DNA-binding domain-containing protein n=1 Tax=Leptospira soteropolitanensis TaxID=2950025 RepID=A0AAW5VBQ9_9LEPT|nr:putative DNA-binding domain-containing protein [Leptospira soteropolitanensis]MCW7491673.1 DNA-binding domain-containing protein [Leptospira soteropolitanensis]MCW7499257.1 DNA-binding domain-containing protein [Leptospira soteropolitanensis]MCW7521151.1 DNA-binding domain-containing protein [Leptospira soteropolitanensis]MCW7525361.1 DNA-binding domain-containing protein [Leptospira soteropolitanensis]MCW7529228.1 DNA-binding domain-containing protein [Leptospira soteropolitanensis]